MEQHIFALVPNVSFGDELIESLQQTDSAIALLNVSYLYRDEVTEIDTSEDVSTEHNVYTYQSAPQLRNGLADAAFNLVVVAGDVPSLGAIVVAGPLASTVGIVNSQPTDTAAPNGFDGTLLAQGVPSDTIKTYSEAIKQGEVLLVLDTTEADNLIPHIERYYAHDIVVTES